MKIGEFAKEVGVAPSTLRYYEDIGLLADVPRIDQRRWYPASYIPILRFIQLAKQTGFTLDEIRDMLQLFDGNNLPADSEWQPVVKQKLQEIEAVIVQYQKIKATLQEMLDCDLEGFTLDTIWEDECESFDM